MNTLDIRPLMRSNYAVLPTDVFSVILGFFVNAPRLLRIFRLVCKRWKNLISKLPVEFMVHNDSCIDIVTSKPYHRGAFEHMTKIPPKNKEWPLIIRPDLAKLPTSDFTLTRVAFLFPNLRVMKLMGCQNIKDDSLKLFLEFSHLESLTISRNDNITSAGLRHISTLTKLKFLCLDYCDKITHEGLHNLSLMTNLSILSLRNNTKIRTLEPLVPLQSLRTLNLWRCGHIPNAGLQPVLRMTSLRALNISYWSLSDSAMTTLGSLTLLQLLVLNSCQHLTDNALSLVSRMTALQLLSIHSCPEVTTRGLQSIYQLPRLTKLYLANFPLSDVCLAGISRLHRLTSLKLDRCPNLTDQAFAHIGRLYRLKSLKLDRCSGFTNAGFSQLKPMNLRAVIVADCKGVDVAKLPELYPDWRVLMPKMKRAALADEPSSSGNGHGVLVASGDGSS